MVWFVSFVPDGEALSTQGPSTRPTPREALSAPSMRNLLAAAVIACLAAAGGAAFVLRAAPTYQSTEVLLIDQARAVTSPGGEGAVTKLNLLRAKYAALIDTEAIAVPVSERTGSALGEVVGAVGATAPPQSLLLMVTARVPSDEKAQRLASATADELIAYLDDEQEAAAIAPADRITLTTVTEAGPGRVVAPTASRAIAVALGAAALALAAAYVAIQLLTAPRRLV